MRKYKYHLLLIALLLLSIIVVGCSSPAATPAPIAKPSPTTSTPTSTPTPTPSPKPLTIRYFAWNPAPPNPFAVGQAWYWNEVEKRTSGRIKMQFFWGGTLAPAAETMNAIKNGIGDAACILASYHPGQTPLWNVASLVVSGDLWAVSMATIDLGGLPALKQELAKWNALYLAPVASGPYWIQSKVAISKLDDLKGLKIRALGEQAKFLSALGATPVSMAYPDVYEAISKGTIDAAVSNWVTSTQYKLEEVAKYMYYLEVGASGFFMGINLDVWNKISPADQKIMLDLAPEQANAYAQIYWIDGNREGRKQSLAKGVKEIDVTAADAAKAREAVKPLWNTWAQDMTKQGLPGKEVVEAWTSAVLKYEAQSTYKIK